VRSIEDSSSGDLGGSRAERRRRWCSVLGDIGGESVGWEVGGRRLLMDHVGLERRASMSRVDDELVSFVAGLVD
jgi:hypothetical protein